MFDPDSNLSYVTLREAELYLEYHLKKAIWDNSTADEQRSALVTATRSIDRLPFKGYPTSETQKLRFPRDGAVSVPNSIKEACIELAVILLEGVDIEQEYRALSRSVNTYGPIKQQKDTSRMEAHIAAGIPSFEAWCRLLPYIRQTGSVTLERNS